MSIKVKKASINDAQAIYEIIQQAFTEYQNNLGTENKVAALCETVEDIKSDIENKHVFIALLDDKPIGSIRYDIDKNGIAYLSRFGVKPDYQKYGAGSSLIKALEEDAAKQGAKAIVLHTAMKMNGLIGFYEHMGYYVVSVSNESGYARALLRKDLQSSKFLYDLKHA